jgi:allantoinase
LTDAEMERIGAPAKCAPPLRDEGSRITDLNSAAIDFVASDHSPAPLSMKQSDDFFKVWGGIAGVQSTRSILLSLEPSVSAHRVASLTAMNVAERFNIRKGRIEVGADADFSLVDVDARYMLEREQLLDRHRLSPYVGSGMRGVVQRTILRGRTIFCDGRMIGGKGAGRLVRPAGSAGHA